SSVWLVGRATASASGAWVGSFRSPVSRTSPSRESTSHFTETTNGLRIKTWARRSLGFVRNVLFHHVVFDGVKNPILIDQNYCPGRRNCPRQASGIKVSDIRYKSIGGTSQSKVAVRFECSKANPCAGITMHDVKLTYVGGGRGEEAMATCANARGTSSGFVTPVVRYS
ncbi:unnamed protein product, partial [Linum tenue]